MIQFKRNKPLSVYKQIFFNLSFNRVITLHLSSIRLYTLNVCPVKSFLRGETAKQWMIGTQQTESQTDWAFIF